MPPVRTALAALFITALLSAATPVATLAQAKPVDINVIVSLTGPGTFLGKGEVDGLNALEGAVNKRGGIRGRPVNFIIHDDQTNPQQSVQLTNQILAGKVSVILGSSLGGTCLAMAPLVTSGPVQYCLSPAIHPKSGSFTFTSNVSTSDYAIAFYRYFRTQKWTRIALITSTDASGQDADEGFGNALNLPEFKDSGLSMVSHEHFNITDLSVSAQMARIRATNPQVIVAYSPGTPFGTLLQGIKQGGLDDVPIATGTANMTYAEMKQYAQLIPKDLIFPGLPYLARQAASPKERAVQDTFYDAFKPLGVVPDLIQSFSWDPASIVIDALRALGPDAGADQIRQYIENLHDYIGINGVYDFRDGSQRGLTEHNLMVMRWDIDKGTWSAVSGLGGGPLNR
jgi:branched-chain amino acid transport system substrate-binding protein